MQKSLELYNRAKRVIPGGVHSNSRARAPHPLYFTKAKGPYITDVDGNEYIDLIMGNGSIIFGHNYEPFVELFNKYLPDGLVTGSETELSIDVSEKFLQFVDHDQVRFTNTGTEAITHVIQMARAYTGKNDIAVCEGAYNGWTDHVFVSAWPDLTKAGEEHNPIPLPGTGGLDPKVVESTVVIPFNKWEETENILRREAHRLACVILEPVMIDVGFIEPDPEYLKNLRALCDELDILLVFDELLTGFRLSLGGAQQYFGVKPDLSTFGKAIANGYVLAAVAGKREVMEVAAPGGKTGFVGTYNGHQVSLAAAKAVFELLEDGTILEELHEMTEQLINEFNNSCSRYGINGVMKGRGGHVHWYFSETPVETYRQAASTDHETFAKFSGKLFELNCLVSGKTLSHHKLSYSHKGEALEKLVERIDTALKSLK